MSSGLAISPPAQQTQGPSNIKESWQREVRSWTAARCHRLLRPLISRIEVLKKDPIRFTSAGMPIGALESTTCPFSGPVVEVSRGNKRARDGDACWKPGRKRIRKTYSTRCKLKGRPHDGAPDNTLLGLQVYKTTRDLNMKPGEISVPTPILNRLKAVALCPGKGLVLEASLSEQPKTKTYRHPQQRRMTEGGELYVNLADDMNQVRKITHTSRFKAYEGIYNALDAILRATSSQDEQPSNPIDESGCSNRSRTGSDWGVLHSRSLFQTCLRKVPSHIWHEEKRAALEAEQTGLKSAFNTRSISAEIYSSLESFGVSGGSWKHLKVVVRAHGVRVVKDAIMEGIIDAKFASVLVMLCVHRLAFDEAETLLTALLRSFRYPDPDSTSNSFHGDPLLLPIITLDTFKSCTLRTDYYHRQLTDLVTRGLLSITWLATNAFGSVWTSVFRSFSNNPKNLDARVFITALLPLIYKEHPPQLCKRDSRFIAPTPILLALGVTLTSVMTALSAMGLLSSCHTSGVISLMRSVVIDSKLLTLNTASHQAACIAMSCLLVGGGMHQTADCAELLLDVLRRNARQAPTDLYSKENIPAFVHAVARCCARGSSGDILQHLKAISQRLMTFIPAGGLEGGFELRQIIVDYLLVFAEHQPEKKHLEYAEQVCNHLKNSVFLCGSQPGLCDPQINKGFRWEEGISEWVAATPKPGYREIRGIKLPTIDEKIHHEHSLQCPSKRRVRSVDGHTVYRSLKPQHLSYTRVSDLGPPSPSPCHNEDIIHSQQHKNPKRLLESFRPHYPSKLSKPPYFDQCMRGVSKPQRFDYGLRSANQNRIFLGGSVSDDELSYEYSGTAYTLTPELATSGKSAGTFNDKWRASAKRPPAKSVDSFRECEDELRL